MVAFRLAALALALAALVVLVALKFASSEEARLDSVWLGIDTTSVTGLAANRYRYRRRRRQTESLRRAQLPFRLGW